MDQPRGETRGPRWKDRRAAEMEMRMSKMNIAKREKTGKKFIDALW